MPTPRRMALTAELVTRTSREIEDAGPSPGAVYLIDEDYGTIVRDVLAQAPPGNFWLFGYGSLLWKPAFEFIESRMATVRGWHRSFCIRVARFRGTRDLPGLMMALDRGGQCQGMVFRVPADRGRGDPSRAVPARARREAARHPAALARGGDGRQAVPCARLRGRPRQPLLLRRLDAGASRRGRVQRCRALGLVCGLPAQHRLTSRRSASTTAIYGVCRPWSRRGSLAVSDRA